MGYLGGQRSLDVRFPGLFIGARNSDEKMENIVCVSSQLPPRLPSPLAAPCSLPPSSWQLRGEAHKNPDDRWLPGALESWVLANSLCSCWRAGGGQVWGRGSVR